MQREELATLLFSDAQYKHLYSGPMTEPTLLVTGANRGIGLEWVRQASRDGWLVHATCRDPARAKELSTLAAESGGRVQVHALEVRDPAAVDALATTLAGVAIDVLLNNAGVYGQSDGGFGRTDAELWRQTFDINVIAPMKLMEAFVDHVAASTQKCMVAISSKMGSITDNTSGGVYVYRSSKAALNMVMRSVSIDLAARGITAVTLHPGWVRTDMGGPNALMEPEESVSAMRRIVAGLRILDAGRFIAPSGEDIPW
jgi:NAD(P)-dependent dehydrogenase (short-subunit alcohol dehydrogenase family)